MINPSARILIYDHMNKLLNLIIMTEYINSNGEENFIVLDGGLGTELTRAGFKIDVRWCKIPIFFYEMTILNIIFFKQNQ